MSTVAAQFAASLEREPQATAITYVAPGGEAQQLSYEALYALGRRAAAGLRSFDLRRDDVVVLAMPTTPEMLGYYLASLCAGVIPLIAPSHDGAAAHVESLAALAGARRVLRFAEARDGIEVGDADLDLCVDPHAIAHLQATSGSTGSPKIAAIRNRNISANVRAIGDAIGERSGDVVVSWLPLYHDMGLICISCTLHWQRPLVLTDAANFVRHPIRYWLSLISSYDGTISPAPTSAYQVCARLAKRRQFESLDLRRWRVGFCGAEPVQARTVNEFHDAFAPYGLPRTTVLPVYGLAEATLAVTIPRQGNVPVFDSVDRDVLASESRAMPASSGAVHVGLGTPLDGHTVTIIDDDGIALPERRVGEIQVHGPSVIDGYWPDLQPLHDGLRTGDFGYLADGWLYVTGRKKDIIIIAGRNLLPPEIEAVAEEVLDTGIHNGVAAVGIVNDDTATEEVHLLVESREVPPPDRESLEERLRVAMRDAFQLSGVHVQWVQKGSIPKTPSGKIQRSRCRETLRERAVTVPS